MGNYRGTPVHPKRVEYYFKAVVKAFLAMNPSLNKMHWRLLANSSELDPSYFSVIRKTKTVPSHTAAIRIDRALKGNGRFVILAGYIPPDVSPTKAEAVFKSMREVTDEQTVG